MKIIKKRIYVIFSIILIIFLGLFAWQKCKVWQDRNVINIGFVVPLTGNAANHGTDLMRGAYMALDDYNLDSESPKTEIRFIVEDNFSTSRGSVTAFQKLVKLNKVWIVLGPIASSDMLAMVPIAEESQTILFSPAASSPALSNAGRYIFRMSLLAPDQTKKIALYAIEDLNKKEAGILHMNDDTGRSYMNSFVSDFTALGGKIVFNESFERTDVDFASHLLRMSASNVDVVYLSGVPQTVGLILKQAREMNMNVIFLGNYGSEGNDLLEIARNAAEGFVYTSIPIDPDFMKRYFELHQRNPDIGVALGYDVASIALYLMKQNPQNREELRSALSDLEFTGVTGKTVILPSGDASKDVELKTVRNGEFVEF